MKYTSATASVVFYTTSCAKPAKTGDRQWTQIRIRERAVGITGAATACSMRRHSFVYIKKRTGNANRRREMRQNTTIYEKREGEHAAQGGAEQQTGKYPIYENSEAECSKVRPDPKENATKQARTGKRPSLQEKSVELSP